MPENSRGEKRSSEENFETTKKPNINEIPNNLNTETEKEYEEKQSDSNLQSINDQSKSTVKYFNGVEISNLSKRQLKKYHKTLKWLDIKKEKRAKERIKTKEKRLHAKLNNIDLGPSRKELKKVKMKNSPCKIGICIDLSFDELMIDKV